MGDMMVSESTSQSNGSLFRKVIHIKAEDSPNVQLGLMQKRAGKSPDNKILIPGILPYKDYEIRMATWDEVRICIGLKGLFYEGADHLLYPPDWLDRAERVSDRLIGERRRALAIGVDTAEGGNNTAMAAVDEYGLLELRSKKTTDTTAIPQMIVDFMLLHSVPPERVMLDAGGGGNIHARYIRNMGYPVRTVAFGDPVKHRPRTGRTPLDVKIEELETRYVYMNVRAQMYGVLRSLLDPQFNPRGFGLPSRYPELRYQLAPIPIKWDKEGRMYLPPKRKNRDNSTEKTLIDIIGHSPDEADALVVAIHAMLSDPVYSEVGAV